MWKLWNMSLWKILNSLINHSEPRDILFHECPRFQAKIYSLLGWKRGHVNKTSYRNLCLSLLDIWVITGLRRLKVGQWWWEAFLDSIRVCWQSPNYLCNCNSALAFSKRHRLKIIFKKTNFKENIAFMVLQYLGYLK